MSQIQHPSVPFNPGGEPREMASVPLIGRGPIKGWTAGTAGGEDQSECSTVLNRRGPVGRRSEPWGVLVQHLHPGDEIEASRFSEIPRITSSGFQRFPTVYWSPSRNSRKWRLLFIWQVCACSQTHTTQVSRGLGAMLGVE